MKKLPLYIVLSFLMSSVLSFGVIPDDYQAKYRKGVSTNKKNIQNIQKGLTVVVWKKKTKQNRQHQQKVAGGTKTPYSPPGKLGGLPEI